jgi:hypothetical protein
MISSLTDIPPHEIREVCHATGNSLRKRVGRASKTSTLCLNRITQIQLSVYAAILRKASKESDCTRIDPERLIRYFDIAQALCPMPQFDLSRAWTLLSELKMGVIALRDCQRCATSYLLIFDQPRASMACPFCAMRHRISRERVIASNKLSVTEE